MSVRLIAHALIRDHDGRVLLIRRAPDNDVLPLVWDIPGGSCESGEDPRVAAVRETREEVGLEIRELQLLDYTSNVDHEKGTQFVRLIFSAQSAGGQVRLNPAEHDQHAWVEPRQPDRTPLVDYLPPLLQTYLTRMASHAASPDRPRS